MEQTPKRGIFGPNKIVAIIAYVLCMFVLGTVFIYLVAAIYAKSNDSVTFDTLIKFISKPNETEVVNLKAYQDASSIVQALANFISYLLAFVIIVFYLRDELKNAFFALIGNKLLWILIPVMAIAFCGLSYLIDYLVGLGVPASTNQTTIELIMQGPGFVFMVLATVIFAPVVEELIFRNVIFHYAKKYSIVASYLISIILFTLPHMLTSDFSNFGVWALQCVPYLVCGAMLCFIYHISKFNIYASITAHMFNNILAVILVVIKIHS